MLNSQNTSSSRAPVTNLQFSSLQASLEADETVESTDEDNGGSPPPDPDPVKGDDPAVT